MARRPEGWTLRRDPRTTSFHTRRSVCDDCLEDASDQVDWEALEAAAAAIARRAHVDPKIHRDDQ